ncbi:MAG: alanine racemase [Candidatus Omnitrophica bacterium]|nr:alanine racemase [Candidatus Omnitrophota bacterium]
MFRPLWIEVDLAILRKNFFCIKRLLSKDVKVIATIKQSAYGHGLIEVAEELVKVGIDFFGVGSLEEAIALRQAGIKKPILVLSAVLSKFANYFVEYKIHPTVVSLEFAKVLNNVSRKAKKYTPVHVKIDTGMGRLGFYYQDAYKFIKELTKLSNLILEGIFTHFPAAEDREFTQYQIKIFCEFIKNLEKEKIYFKYKHCANSMGVLLYPEAHFNMVRPGLILYGILPAKNIIDIKVKPILSLKSRVIFVKEVKKGMGISYSRTFITKTKTKIATVAIGYADGYPWALSNNAKVIIKDSYFDLVGRVCMDHIMVNIKNRDDIIVGDEVILIGSKKGLTITAQDLADWAKTIPYEILSHLSLKIPRIYKNPFKK